MISYVEILENIGFFRVELLGVWDFLVFVDFESGLKNRFLFGYRVVVV